MLDGRRSEREIIGRAWRVVDVVVVVAKDMVVVVVCAGRPAADVGQPKRRCRGQRRTGRGSFVYTPRHMQNGKWQQRVAW